MVRAARNGLCRSITHINAALARFIRKRTSAERDEHHIVIAVESGYQYS